MDKEIYRPKTRGDLCTHLKQGIPCEVASHVVEMTNIILKSWLNFSDFKVEYSHNKGWVIYYPTKTNE